jgi:hypothetical protein
LFGQNELISIYPTQLIATNNVIHFRKVNSKEWSIGCLGSAGLIAKLTYSACTTVFGAANPYLADCTFWNERQA